MTPSRHRGLTLLEFVVALGVLSIFLVLSYDSLIKVLTYPRQSLQRFSDRAEALVVEKTVIESVKIAQDGYTWAHSEGGRTLILMGLAREFRPSDESPVTDYLVLRHDPATSWMLRWSLTPDKVETLLGALRPHSELSERQWGALADLPEPSIVGRHVRALTFDLGAEDLPIHFGVEVHSEPALAGGKAKGVPYRIERWLSKVKDATE